MFLYWFHRRLSQIWVFLLCKMLMCADLWLGSRLQEFSVGHESNHIVTAWNWKEPHFPCIFTYSAINTKGQRQNFFSSSHPQRQKKHTFLLLTRHIHSQDLFFLTSFIRSSLSWILSKNNYSLEPFVYLTRNIIFQGGQWSGDGSDMFLVTLVQSVPYAVLSRELNKTASQDVPLDEFIMHLQILHLRINFCIFHRFLHV